MMIVSVSFSAPNNLAAQMVRRVGSAQPVSFNGDAELFGLNLFLMTAFMWLGLMMAGAMVRAIWQHRHWNRPRHQVTIWRLAWLFAGCAVFLRCGAEAMSLWAWDPADPETTARMLMVKRWIDPLALAFVGAWMMLVVLSNTAMEQQLSRLPLPVNMATRLPSLQRPLAVVLLSLVAAIGVVLTR